MDFARPRRSAITGRASITAGVPVFDASPSESMAGIAASENGPSRRIRLLIAGACSPRSVSTGVDSSASAPRRTIVGSSSSRKRGSVSMSSASASRFSAVASATSLELRIELATRSRSRASGASTVSELTASCSSWSFWRARISSTLSVSCSAGLARRMTSLRSLPRPATPVPSSLRISDSRSRSGSRIVLPIRSMSTVCIVFSTGSRYWPSPGPSSISLSRGGGSLFAVRGCVGLHSTKRSPIRFCGRTMQLASRRKSW